MSNYSEQNLNTWELKFSYWFVSHKLLLRQIFIIFLIVLAVLFWFYVLWQSVFYLINYQKERASWYYLSHSQSQSLTDLTQKAPQTLVVSDILLLNQTAGQSEYLVKVTNPNSDWLAAFNYQFVTGGDGGYKRQSFIMPGQSKYLLDSKFGATAGSFQLSDLKWERVANFEQLRQIRNNFSYQNEKFLAGAKPGDPNRVTFDLTNNSSFGYWQVEIKVLLLSGGDIVSGNTIVLEQFKAGETRPVELHWNIGLPRITGLEIIPEVNFLDASNIMKPEGEIGEY